MAKVVYFIWLLVAFITFVCVPNVGENAFIYYGIASHVMFILGIIPFVAIVISFVNEHKKNNNPESYADKEVLILKKRNIIGFVIFSAAILFMGIARLSAFYKDLGNEPVHAVLRSADVKMEQSGSAKSRSISYKLTGYTGTEKITIDLKGIGRSERERIARSSGPLEITYYPNTKVLVNYSYEQSSNVVAPYNSYNSHSGNEKGQSYEADSGKSQRSGNAYEELINESNLPFELLSQVEKPENYGNNARLCKESSDGYVKAYCSKDSENPDKYIITKLSIDGGDYSILGIKVGDTLDNDRMLQIATDGYMQEYVSVESAYYPMPDGCREVIYSRSPVYIFFYVDSTSVIRQMRVFIYDGDEINGAYKLDYE